MPSVYVFSGESVAYPSTHLLTIDNASLFFLCLASASSQLVQAVQALQLPATAKQASKWLEEFQSSPHAWAVADQCLTQKVNPQVSFFAARTMRYKIQSYFHELPTASHEQLRSSLVTQLQSFCVHAEAGTRIVITQLALAMASEGRKKNPFWTRTLLWIPWCPISVLSKRYSTLLVRVMYADGRLLVMLSSRHRLTWRSR